MGKSSSFLDDFLPLRFFWKRWAEDLCGNTELWEYGMVWVGRELRDPFQALPNLEHSRDGAGTASLEIRVSAPLHKSSKVSSVP